MSLYLHRIWLGAATAAVLAVIGFYASRLLMPLPIFSGDEAAYLIRALYPDGVVAADPAVAQVINGLHLSVIRAVDRIGAPMIVGDRLVNAAAYLAGLALLWRTGAKGLRRTAQVGSALIAFGFPYYRFAFSDLPEGLFVGVLAVLCAVTGRWYRRRPIFHALAAGGLAAALVLVKPNGIAVVAALGVLAVLDALLQGDWRRLPVRALLFAAMFYGLGNLIQWAAEEPMNRPWAFFVGEFYGAALAFGTPPHALRVALLAMGAMVSSAAVLAGAPAVIGLSELAARWRARRDGFVAEGRDFIFLLLLLSLAATLAMVTVFSVKMAWDPASNALLWGRYFECYVPLIWLSAAPALTQTFGRGTAWACAGVMLAGLAGLLASFHAGIVLFPWDSSALTAFFHTDPVRAPLGRATPYRAMAVLATAAAAVALALKARPIPVGLALTLALAGLSTHLDHVWLGPRVQMLAKLDEDLRTVSATLPPAPAGVILLATDVNDADLAFLRLDARPWVLFGPPGKTRPEMLASARAVVVLGPDTPPGGPWARVFKGQTLSLFEPAPPR